MSTRIYAFLDTYRGRVYNIKTALDAMIPFNKYFILPYLYWYIYMGIIFFYFAVVDEKKYYKLLFGINMGMIISYFIYYIFPTTVPRPQVYGQDMFAYLVRMVYNNDNPYNCFPSLHVLNTVLAAIYVNRDESIDVFYKYLSSLIAVSIIFSTFFVKQHYIYDAISATIIAYGVYFVFNYKEVKEKFMAKNYAKISE